MAYDIPIEELELKNYCITLDCIIEIDDGGPGDWAIESITIKSYSPGEPDIFLTRKDILFHAIKESIMSDRKRTDYIDGEAEENNTPSLIHKPSWY